jgi:ferritin-like protein
MFMPLHLEDLDLSDLSYLRDLRKVLIAGRCEAGKDVSVGEKEAHLRAISERARKLKYKLRREVRVFVSFAGCDSKRLTDDEVEITGDFDLDIDAI